MRAKKEYLPCFLWRRAVWLAPLGLLLVPLLMLKGQDTSPNGATEPVPLLSPAAAPVQPDDLDAEADWHPRAGAWPGDQPERTVDSPTVPGRGLETSAVEIAPLSGSAEESESANPVQQPDAPDQAQVTPQQRALLGAARAAVARGDLPGGISRFQEYLGLNPKDNTVRREYAGLLVRARQTQRAIEQYEMLLKALPDNSAIHLDLANVYLQIRRPQKAIPHLLAAQKGSPRDHEIATRLAQAYVGEGDLAKARSIVNQLLSRLRPGAPEVPASFGRLLLDLKRPRQALTFLLPERANKPNDVDLLADVIRARGWLGQRGEASRLIGELAGKQPRDVELRLALANALYRLKEYPLARLVYNQALQIEPKNIEALVGMARVDIQMFNVKRAAAFLESCQAETAPTAALGAGLPTPPIVELLALARGELYFAVGKYAEAIQILRCYLQRDPDDADCRVLLAQVYEATGDYEKAKAEWAKLGLLRPERELSVLGLARVLGTQWRFAESNALVERVLAEDPESFVAVAQMVHNLGKMKRVDEAVGMAQAYVSRPHEDDNGPVVVSLALGRVLLEIHRYEEAAAVYEPLLNSPLGRVGAAYFGLYYARMQLHQTGDPHEILGPVLEGTLRDRIELIDEAALFNVNALVIDVSQGILANNPEHLPTLLRLGEAELRLAVLDLNIDPATDTANLILRISPTNVRGRFLLARAFALGRSYHLAFLEYEKLIKTDADLLQARKELARTLYTASCYHDSHLQYELAQYPTGDEVLQNALGHLTLNNSSAPHDRAPSSAMPKPMGATSENARGRGLETSPSSGPISQARFDVSLERPLPADNEPITLIQAASESPAAKQETLPSPRPLPAGESTSSAGEPAKDAAELAEDCKRRDKRAEIDADARAAEVKAVHEEQVAKGLMGLRNYEAVGAYLTLLADQPDNTTAMFDLAQVYASINQTRPLFNQNSQLPVAFSGEPAPSGLTHAAIDEASELLWVDPYNRDAAVFREGAQMALQPRLRPQLDLFTQNGRNGLARIEIDSYSGQAIYPFGDEGDYVGLGYSRIALIPHNYVPLTGNVPSLLFGYQFTDRLRLTSQLNVEQYENRISTRPTYDLSLNYDVASWWEVYGASSLHNVLQNGESIRQDIFREDVELGNNFHFTRNLDATALYRIWGYSDHNIEQDAYALASYRLLPAPYELKFLTSLYFEGFEHTNPLSTRSPVSIPGDIVPPGFPHPYFAPHEFFYWENKLSFRQTLSRDLFKYAQNIWYQPEYGIALDDRNHVYHHFHLALNWDVSTWLRAGVAADTVLSSVYTLGVGYAFIELRMPPR
jgi:tetratricopeptide (TPR) repeat protein